ncbi:hypothetical protein MKZ38_007513 [Zalerion maritima]|uniref:Uncharacterized protein n=1 Tax=Zalerion maritima TaxID=339359 RepID=A0AAD5RHL8_9PEZI|nr:hypothetical protein MKZ38_007513 [Zalerion maritima]
MKRLDWLCDFREMRVSNDSFYSRQATDDGESFLADGTLALRLDEDRVRRIANCSGDGVLGLSGVSEFTTKIGGLRGEHHALREEVKKLSGHVWNDADNEALLSLTFDTSGVSDVQGMRCVVIERTYNKQQHYTLPVGRLRESMNIYERVGVGVIHRRQILEGSELEVRII